MKMYGCFDGENIDCNNEVALRQGSTLCFYPMESFVIGVESDSCSGVSNGLCGAGTSSFGR